MKKILSVVLTIVLFVCMTVTSQISTGASSTYTMPLNGNLLSAVGAQNHNGYACSCYALAYCRTIIDGRVHNYSEYNRYGNTETNVDCIWSRGNCTSKNANSTKALLRTCYDYVNNNLPLMIHVTSSYGQHWLTVVGYQNVSDPNNMVASNLIVIDPWYGYPPRTNGYSIHSNLQYVVPNDNFPVIGNNPEGCFDWVKSNSPGTIQVHGWAFDRDNLGASLAIHIYVGGPAGSGAPGYAITANKSRPDVNNAYPGVGNNHGFDDTIRVSKTGLQTIYVYAINVGSGNDNPLLGYQNVFVKTDAEKPTISNITVSQVTSKGYRISCKVSDNVGVTQVKFPTWTLKTDSKGNDQDDLVWHVGSIDGSIATYYVKTSDHNNETGGYVTDIYAYDNAGNSNMTRASISVTNEPKMISSTKYNGNTYKVFNFGMTWIQAKEWCEKQGGHLATISNSSEWNAVKQALEKYNGVPCWLGAESTSGTWKWVTGENLTYTNWSSGQPDCAGKNEFYLGAFNDSKKWLDCYLWNDYPCDGAGLIGGFVCEFEKTTLTLSRYSGSIYVKGTAIFRPTVKNGKGVTTYKSNNTRVAKVDSGGKLTALKAGTAKITITNNKVSKVFTVKVLNPKLNKTSVSISRGKSYTLKITGKIGKAKFYTSNKKIATVNSKGKIKVNKKAKKGKIVIIKVKTNGITLKCKVKVK